MPGIYFEGADYTSPRPLNQGAEIVPGVCSQACEFGRVMVWEAGAFRLASPVDGRTSGVCISLKGEVGKQIDVLTAGTIEASDWTGAIGEQTLTPGAAYFLRLDGNIGIIPYSDGFIVRVGRAVSPTILLVTFDLKVS